MEDRMFNLCKMFGGFTFTKDGVTTEYVFDYDRNECVLKSEMDKERWAKSERKKHEKMKIELEKLKHKL